MVLFKMIVSLLILASAYLGSATAMDLGVVGPKGRVLLFSLNRDGKSIDIKKCTAHTVIKSPEDCVQEPGSTIRTVDSSKLLKAFLTPGVLHDLNGDLQSIIELARKSFESLPTDQLMSLEEYQNKIKKIADFISTYGKDAADLDELDRLNSLLPETQARETLGRYIDNYLGKISSGFTVSAYSDNDNKLDNQIAEYLAAEDCSPLVRRSVSLSKNEYSDSTLNVPNKVLCVTDVGILIEKTEKGWKDLATNLIWIDRYQSLNSYEGAENGCTYPQRLPSINEFAEGKKHGVVDLLMTPSPSYPHTGIYLGGSTGSMWTSTRGDVFHDSHKQFLGSPNPKETLETDDSKSLYSRCVIKSD